MQTSGCRPCRQVSNNASSQWLLPTCHAPYATPHMSHPICRTPYGHMPHPICHTPIRSCDLFSLNLCLQLLPSKQFLESLSLNGADLNGGDAETEAPPMASLPFPEAQFDRVQSPDTGGLSHSSSHGGHFALALVAGSGAGAASMVLVSALLFRRRNRGGRLARRELESA